MKKITALSMTIILSCTSLFVHAQDGGSTARHEIQVSVENVLNIFSPGYLFNSSIDEDLYSIYDDYDDYGYYTYSTNYNPLKSIHTYYLNKPKICMGYKFHMANQALRFNMHLDIDDNEMERTYISESSSYDYWDDYPAYSVDTSTRKYSMNSIFAAFSLGYEHFLATGNVEPYVGADLQYVQLSTKGGYTIPVSESSNDYGFDMSTSTEIKRQTFALVPFGGARIYFGPSVSVSTEIRWTLMYYMDKISASTNYSKDKTESENEGMKTYFGPMGQIGINFHF